MTTPADEIRAGLALADHALAFAERVAQAFGLLDPIRRAARLRARALRLRARADALHGRPFDWPRRDRLRARAAGLDIRADALAPELSDEPVNRVVSP